MLPFAKALAIFAVSVVAAAPAGAASLGYGVFLGTWQTTPGDGDGNENPQGTAAGADLIGSLILNDPQASGTSAGAFTPDPFSIDEFNVAGGRAFPGSNLSSVIEFTLSEDLSEGTWVYNGSAGVQDPTDPGAHPGQEPIDLYLAVKYGNSFSVFYYDNVQVGDEGRFTSDGAMLSAANLNLALPGYGGSYSFEFGACDPTITNVNDPQYCMPYNGANPHDISHVVGYWPPGEMATVPVPPAALLLGTALLCLFSLNRMRRLQPLRG